MFSQLKPYCYNYYKNQGYHMNQHTLKYYIMTGLFGQPRNKDTKMDKNPSVLSPSTVKNKMEYEVKKVQYNIQNQGLRYSSHRQDINPTIQQRKSTRES